MKQTKRFVLEGNYREFLTSCGINIEKALREIGRPENLFSRKNPVMRVEDYFAFMEAIGSQADSALPIRIGTADELKFFAPPIFAAYCSRDGRTCIKRLAQYKKLIGPLVLTVDECGKIFSVTMTTDGEAYRLPRFLVETEFVFMVNLLRSATGRKISPCSASFADEMPGDGLRRFLNCSCAADGKNTLRFSADDMDVPFASRNDIMWSYFEPELRRRLADTDTDDSLSARVRSALIELLPRGDSGIDATARRIGISRRTLQRRLADESTTYQEQLNHTRQLLAKHYLQNTDMITDEIAYLLGYRETNSFLRAFCVWTGKSVSDYKKSLRS